MGSRSEQHMKKIIFLICCLLYSLAEVKSQNYHAIHGSSYAGSLGVGNNPASIVNTDYPWDINLLSFQAASSTNAVTVLNYSLLSAPVNSLYRIDKGDFDRYAKANYNLHLFNARFALNQKSAVSFGINLRGYSDVQSNKYNYIDTIKTLRNFLKINEQNTDLSASIQSTNWLELFGTYSRTLQDAEKGRLNAGITVKATRAIAGMFTNLQSAVFTRGIVNNKPVYFAKGGGIKYGYSSTLDRWLKGRSAGQNFSDMLVNSETGISFDLGMEYLIKSQAVLNFNDDDSYFDYEWKIGVSLLDVGASKYSYGIESRAANGNIADISDSLLQRKFKGVKKMHSINDSLATIFTGLQTLTGTFSIINPVRLVINVDRYLFGDFYLNGELSANLTSVAGSTQLKSSEISLLTVTPRWETRRYGVYLPVQMNAERQFWVGAAVKAGPLLMGVHNLGYIFSTKKLQDGGGYLALVLRPGSRTKAHRDKRYDCPR